MVTGEAGAMGASSRNPGLVVIDRRKARGVCVEIEVMPVTAGATGPDC